MSGLQAFKTACTVNIYMVDLYYKAIIMKKLILPLFGISLISLLVLSCNKPLPVPPAGPAPANNPYKPAFADKLISRIFYLDSTAAGLDTLKTLTFSYDVLGNLKGFTTKVKGSATLLSSEYSYNAGDTLPAVYSTFENGILATKTFNFYNNGLLSNDSLVFYNGGTQITRAETRYYPLFSSAPLGYFQMIHRDYLVLNGALNHTRTEISQVNPTLGRFYSNYTSPFFPSTYNNLTKSMSVYNNPFYFYHLKNQPEFDILNFHRSFKILQAFKQMPEKAFSLFTCRQQPVYPNYIPAENFDHSVQYMTDAQGRVTRIWDMYTYYWGTAYTSLNRYGIEYAY